MAQQENGWHLDKKVPIGLIVALLVHLAGSVWFASAMVSENRDTTRRVGALEQARSTERVSERLAVVESQTADTKAATLRIEANVQKLVERRP